MHALIREAGAYEAKRSRRKNRLMIKNEMRIRPATPANRISMTFLGVLLDPEGGA